MINFINNPNTNTNTNSNKGNKFLNGTKIASNRIKVPVPLSPQTSINTEGDTVFDRFSYRNVQSNSEIDISNKRNTNIISNDNTTNDLTNDLVFENKKQDQPISSSTYLYKIQQRASRQ